MQYKIPQNVGIEDKIVGPLTLRQLIILAVGFGISYVLFAIISKLYELNILEYVVIVLPGLFSAAFALVRINDIPLTKYLFLFLEFAIKPKRRVWDHRGIVSIVSPDLTQETVTTAVREDESGKKARTAGNLSELTRMLDSGGFEHVRPVVHTDMDKTKDDDLVTEAYFGNKRDQSATQNMYWRTKDSQMKRLNILASLPVTELKKGTKETAIAQEQILKAKEEVDTNRKTSIENMKAPLQKPQPAAIQTKQNEPNIQANKTIIPSDEKTIAKPKPAQTVKPSAPVKPLQPKQQPVKPVPQVKNEVAASAQVNPAKSPEKPGKPVSGGQSQTKKNPRKRNRPVPQPVRENNKVNTTNKSEPAKYIPDKPPADKPSDKPTKKADTGTKAGEFDFRELQKGEIEINLDD